MQLKTRKDLEKLQQSGKILAETLKQLKIIAEPGTVLKELDQKAKQLLKEKGAQSAFFQFQPAGASKPYPAHICASVNEQVVHGVPDSYTLQEGDILSLDLGVRYKKLITDGAITFPIGHISDEDQKLINSTKKALKEALSICKPGIKTGDIGAVIQKNIEGEGFTVIKSLTGHGVGFELHEEPAIYNFGKQNTGLEFKEGMVLAIEPMASISSEQVKRADDDSFVTKDGSKSAHFEATVAIVKSGVQVLTPTLDI